MGYVRNEQEWPIKRTRFSRKFLQAPIGHMIDDLPYGVSSASYDSLSTVDNAQFVQTFERETELTVNMRIRLWV